MLDFLCNPDYIFNPVAYCFAEYPLNQPGKARLFCELDHIAAIAKSLTNSLEWATSCGPIFFLNLPIYLDSKIL